MTQPDLRYWIALNVILCLISPRKAGQLLKYYGSPEAIFDAGRKSWGAIGLTEKAISALSEPDWAAVEATLQWAEQPGNSILLIADPEYPQLLREISDPPLLLHCQGNPSVLNNHQIAIVGSRNPTPTGYETAQSFSAQLAKTGFTVISGMALGIDAAAHLGALQTDSSTIAVTGTGLDRVYPARHDYLVEQIKQNGAVISEFPLGTAPIGRNFPLRNRIISGMSCGVLVVEAALRSGSLITAKQALDQGREVFAMPGSIHHPNSRGCHALLREGAKLVESVTDILEEIDNFITRKTAYTLTNVIDATDLPNDDYHRVLSAIDMVAVNVDVIVERSGLTPDAVCSMLLVLEMRGYVHISGTGQYCRAVERSHNEREHSRCADVLV